MTNIIRILNEADFKFTGAFRRARRRNRPHRGRGPGYRDPVPFCTKWACRTMATTHYSELKVFALSADGVENACCEFNVETLSPTYRLLIGIPGKSNAFAISRKLGLPDFLIEDARGHCKRTERKLRGSAVQSGEQPPHHRDGAGGDSGAYKKRSALSGKPWSKKQEKLEAQRDRILREANGAGPDRFCRRPRITADETMKNFHKFGNG